MTPSSTPDDDELLDLLQLIIAGIGGYSDPTLVRPSWQTPDIPNDPDFVTDWVGFRIKDLREDTFQYEEHVPEGTGYSLFEYSEEIDLLISCYGPHSMKFARTLRDGFRLSTNRAALQQHKMDTLYCSNPVTIPALMMNVWRRKVDFTVTLRRYVTSKYRVLTILSVPLVVDPQGAMGVDNEKYIEPILVTPPVGAT